MARRDIRRQATGNTGNGGGGSGGGSSRQPRAGKSKRSIWVKLLIWLGALGVLAASLVFGVVYFEAQSLPSMESLKSSQNGQTILVRGRDGSQLVVIGPSYGQWLDYDRIPAVMKDAIVSTEDRRFREHIGVDPIGILRSLFVRVEKGHWRQGGSTITQQLARNIFLNNNRTFTRKFKEIFIAMALEWKFSKDQILELYLNKVYFGGGAYGVDAASRKFFNHPGTQLSLPEAAIVAGLVKAPSHYSPTADAQAAVDRASVVLDVMEDAGAITPAEHAAVHLDKVHLAAEPAQNSVRYFTDWALPQLDTLIGTDNTEPVEVWTTLDPKMQAAATSAVAANAPKGAQGALVSLDRDGGVLAMVGGTDYVTSNYNRATQAMRQPGSAWKLFVYLAALEAGVKPDDPIMDEPVTIDGWTPHNDAGRYAGQIDIRTAFAYSKNTVAAQLGQKVGFDQVAAMARRFGITTPVATNPSMVLGTNEVRLIEMARAFSEVQAHGSSVEPYGITKVVTASGRVLYQHPAPQGQTLVAPFVAAGITDLLQTAVNIGTGRAAQIGRPAAGKTGTTSSNKDGWFMGFSSGITTGVWMGRDDAKPVPGLQGGTAPARAWAAYMRVATAGRPPEPFDTELKLPEWQLEPDDQAGMGDPDAYYSPDEQGNLVGPDGQPVPQGQQQGQPQAPAGQQRDPAEMMRGDGPDGQQEPVPLASPKPSVVPKRKVAPPVPQPGQGIY